MFADFAMPELKKLIWDYRYIHTFDDGNHLFYLCGISQPTLFAHQLAVYKAQCNLATITSSYMALVQAYRALFGPTFRQTHMALEMIKHEYKIQQSMSSDSIARLLPIAPSVTIDLALHKEALLEMIGLCYQERERL